LARYAVETVFDRILRLANREAGPSTMTRMTGAAARSYVDARYVVFAQSSLSDSPT
jgi:hypothetical protein